MAKQHDWSRRSIPLLTRSMLFVVWMILLSDAGALIAQSDVTARLSGPPPERGQEQRKQELQTAVFWLDSVGGSISPRLTWSPEQKYRLLQKNKMFSPHLLVVPVGATVAFPNADPFFHNVFSLFDGKRFDLGLYETGSSRDVHFDRSGVSYIFCDIHPEMAAVVIALKTPLWATASPQGTFHIADVPAGVYDAHVWLEGGDDKDMAQWTHRITVPAQGKADGGVFQARPEQDRPHLDKFGHPYKPVPSEY